MPGALAVFPFAEVLDEELALLLLLHPAATMASTAMSAAAPE